MKKILAVFSFAIASSLLANMQVFPSQDPTRAANMGYNPWEQRSYGADGRFCPNPAIQQPQFPLTDYNMQQRIPGQIVPGPHTQGRLI